MGDAATSLRTSLTAYAPLFGLRIRTPRLTIELPTDYELLELLEVIEQGIHDPSWMPFRIPWTDTARPQRDADSLRHWWSLRTTWSPAAWNWCGAVRHNGRLVGVQHLIAEDFTVLREVSTASWLGVEFQGQGLGKEMRAAILHLAFDGLGAIRAHSGYVEGNEASRRVSEALGYQPNGYSTYEIRGRPTREERVVLDRSTWERRRRDDIAVDGLDACLDLFGGGSRAAPA